MKKLMTGLILMSAMINAVAFAEGGSDRLVERMQGQAKAQAVAQEKARKELRDTAKSEDASHSHSS